MLIAKPGDELDKHVRDKLEQLVCAAVACGYANTVDMEGSAGEDFKPRTTPDLEPLGAFWITDYDEDAGEVVITESRQGRSEVLFPARLHAATGLRSTH